MGGATGETATVFVRDPADGEFYRRTTNIVKPDGARAVGTKLGSAGPVHPVVAGGGVYRGEAVILGKEYFTVYAPIYGPTGDVEGVLYVGADKSGVAAAWRGAVVSTLLQSLLVLSVTASVAWFLVGRALALLTRFQGALGAVAGGDIATPIPDQARGDEIGALAQSFAHMTKRLKVLEALNLDASPLTGLPGNLAIENRIEQLLAKGKSFSLCQVDLDNFKPFADKYGYAWGSEVIKEVADILQGYIREAELADIFLGHIGGDDFVVIGNPDHVQSICKRLVMDFEKRILSFYESQDAQNGYFIGKNRQGIVQKFPLITITAAIVTDDGSRFKNPLDMARLVAELKEYAKMMPGSNYVTEEYVEKRKLSQPQNL
ncbi:MAG: hypothetical protein CVU63_14000 [Deltaproteobacteria bacterium HGW-Deltaproteobacteria-20]|nr:MAG: hypothetical protein CVU63_14000 [Deltaproteobacteria bacterium HGW-Deltaproteobacteria-20]